MNEISEQQSSIVQAMSGGRDWHVFFEALETMEGQVGGLSVKKGHLANLQTPLANFQVDVRCA